MFSAARALLHAKGSKPLTHAGVLSELGRLYVRPGLLAVEVAGKLRKGRDRRADADYGAGETAVPFTQSEAEALHRDAEAFVAEARKLLGR